MRSTRTTWPAGPAASLLRSRRSLVYLALLVAILSSAGLRGSQGATGAPSGDPIRHIVVILQENHSFDNVLGYWCKVRARCNGATSGRLASGRVIALREARDHVVYVQHGDKAHLWAWHRGQMNGFSRILGCGQRHDYACYTQYRPRDIPDLSRLARHFVVDDRIFETDGVPSWGSHLELATGGTLDGFTGDNPTRPVGAPLMGWGCDSGLDAPWRSAPTAAIQLEPSCVPDQNGNGPYRPSPVQWVPTIMDRLGAAGRSWKLYSILPSMGAQGYTAGGYGWAICPTFADCLDSSQDANNVPLFNVIDDARAGTLPDFSVVTPSSKLSQHNSYSMLTGDNYIGQIMSALMQGPEWSSTAVVITYDDFGGFYDHVASPDGTDALRLPFVIVSPWAKPGYTDHSYGTLSSIDAFVEHTFGLQPLDGKDAAAYDLQNAFDFSQTPLSAIPMTHTAVPARERRAIARQPQRPDVT
jgi:phospholipase C